MTIELAKMLSNALAQYIANSEDMDPADRPADLALAQAELDRADAFLAAEAYVCADCGDQGHGGWNCLQCGGHNIERRY